MTEQRHVSIPEARQQENITQSFMHFTHMGGRGRQNMIKVFVLSFCPFILSLRYDLKANRGRCSNCLGLVVLVCSWSFFFASLDA
jgi:hypothetical protein